jgi:hypothetical protein
MVGGPQSRSGRFGEEKDLLPVQGIQTITSVKATDEGKAIPVQA